MKQLVVILICMTSTFSIARELSSSERQIFAKAQIVKMNQKDHLSRLNAESYSISKYLSYLVLKNGCEPFDELVREIENDVHKEDKSTDLIENYTTCMKSTVALKDFDESDI